MCSSSTSEPSIWLCRSASIASSYVGIVIQREGLGGGRRFRQPVDRRNTDAQGLGDLGHALA